MNIHADTNNRKDAVYVYEIVNYKDSQNSKYLKVFINGEETSIDTVIID